MSWETALPFALMGGGGLLNALGIGKGKQTQYTPMLSPAEQNFRNSIMSYLQGNIGKGATPYAGPLTAPVDPMLTQAMGMASNYYFGQPYQQPQPGTFQGYMPQQPQQQPQQQQQSTRQFGQIPVR